MSPGDTPSTKDIEVHVMFVLWLLLVICGGSVVAKYWGG